MGTSSADDRLTQVLELITKLASGDLAARLPTTEAGDSTELIAGGLNMLGEELLHSMVSREQLEKRIDKLSDVVTAYAQLDFDRSAEVDDRADSIARLGLALNMLGEELSASITAEKRAREDLERRVLERTAELNDKVKTIEDQRRSILELSTPVIETWDDILILPVIGTIDTVRSAQIVKGLLEAVARNQATVAIMDITGVPVIDTGVAGHFMDTVRAARLLGTKVILTGVSPRNAQTLVKLGVDLEELVTKSSLRAGLELAFKMTGHVVHRRDLGNGTGVALVHK